MQRWRKLPIRRILAVVSGLALLGWWLGPFVWREDRVLSVAPYDARFQPTSSLLAISTADGIGLWQPNDPPVLQPLRDPQHPVERKPDRFNLDWSRDGRYLATNGDGMTEVWDAAACTVVAHLSREDVNVWDIAMSPDHAHPLVALSSSDGLLIWDWQAATPPRHVGTGLGEQLAFSVDGQYLITPALLWHLPSARALHWDTDVQIDRPASCLAASPQSMLVALCGYNGKVTLVDLATLTAQRIIQSHHGAINTLAFSPDGRWLAVGPGFGEGQSEPEWEIHIWDVNTGQLVRTLHSPTLRVVERLSFSGDGAWLAATAWQRTWLFANSPVVHVWSLR